MKKFLMAFSIVLLSAQAMATSPMSPRHLLQYRQVPASTATIPNKLNLKTLTVYENGVVVASVHTQAGTKVVATSKLNNHKLDRIIELVKDADGGQVKKVFPGVACFVASPFIHNYTAKNGQVLLYRGHVCNGPLLVNQTKAAAKLQTILNELTQKAFKQPVLVE